MVIRVWNAERWCMEILDIHVWVLPLRYLHPSVHCSSIPSSQGRGRLGVHQRRNGPRRCGTCVQMEYYSATNKNAPMPYAATWVDLGSIAVSDVSLRNTHTLWYRLRVESKKTDTNELIYKTGIDSWTYKTNSWSPKGRAWRHKLGVWDEEIHDTICRIDKQQGLTW